MLKSSNYNEESMLWRTSIRRRLKEYIFEGVVKVYLMPHIWCSYCSRLHKTLMVCFFCQVITTFSLWSGCACHKSKLQTLKQGNHKWAAVLLFSDNIWPLKKFIIKVKVNIQKNTKDYSQWLLYVHITDIYKLYTSYNSLVSTKTNSPAVRVKFPSFYKKIVQLRQ